MNPPTAETTAVTHPLEPLTADEVAQAARVLKADRGLGPTARFVFIALREPPKDVVRAFSPDGPPPPREAHIVLYEKGERTTYEAVVSLTEEAVTDWRAIEGVQAPIMGEEFMACEELVQADPRWQEAMRKRGIEDFSLCMVDPWASGYTGPEDHPSKRRICRPLTWVRSEVGEHGYARPIEGVICIVDLDEMKVVDVEDHGVVPLPPLAGNYDLDRMGADGNVPRFERPRADVKPIEITQPEGASFTVDGHGVEWQKWHLRVGFAPREGLILHDVRYEDHGELRPVLYRASLAEMFVPYGDPSPTHRIKNVFDQGEYGIGWLSNPLELGCDCLGEIHYFDGVVNDQDGDALVIPNAVCMHEEDTGIGWKHTDFRTGDVEVRRQRRLVISSIATVGNYEYGYFWYLYTDGTIEYDIKLTGVISTGALPEGVKPKHGTLVAPGLYGPHHQHFFCMRLDMAVDGDANTVVEVDSEPLPPGPENPYGNAWVDEAHAAHARVGGAAADRPAAGALLEDREPGQAVAGRRPRRLQARPGRQRAADVRRHVAVRAARGLRAQPRVGDRVRPVRALRGRRLPEPAPGRRGAAEVRGGRPPARGHRRGALVLVRRAPHRAARGLAGHARRRTSASSSSRPASSRATRRWTCRRRRTAPTTPMATTATATWRRRGRRTPSARRPPRAEAGVRRARRIAPTGARRRPAPACRAGRVPALLRRPHPHVVEAHRAAGRAPAARARAARRPDAQPQLEPPPAAPAGGRARDHPRALGDPQRGLAAHPRGHRVGPGRERRQRARSAAARRVVAFSSSAWRPPWPPATTRSRPVRRATRRGRPRSGRSRWW